ncbi:MAG TPA: M1 family metallopeptidase [Woeseiaceae bacterium]|nr:M1 family metallopeptidase [Woeseiaceae bacterium]
MRYVLITLTSATLLASIASASAIRQTKGDHYDAFRQLSVDLPAPNVYRSASGAPGPEYWQQRADYDIEVALDEEERRIEASETVRYTNNSPATLEYLWVQLDQNRFRDGSTARLSQTAREFGVFPKPAGKEDEDFLTYGAVAREQAYDDAEYGYDITRVAGPDGRPLAHTVVDTMMRIDLPEPLAPGSSTRFSIDWSFNVLHQRPVDSRGGYEHFPETDTYIYFLAQWFPRMAAYTDYDGWQHKAFLGTGEFTLEYGNYEVAITVPADHIIAATGVLQNPADVLTAEQRRRLDSAGTEEPVFIVTPEEAAANEQSGTDDVKTWVFRAENVRDFAWASSRKFIWDAMLHEQDSTERPTVLAMSFYPNEAEPIWSKYSTHAVAHTLDVYSRFTFPYPYPVAQSVNTWQSGGMEYPMITFNGYRPEPFEPDEDEAIADPPDVTWPRRVNYGLVGVVIHEVGHMYFPMVVNSDERQWSWMDEGLNSFLEYMAELEWAEDFPAYGEHVNVLDAVTEYMTSEQQVPIMTQADATLQRGPNAYTKPTAALVVLRETVLGRELFDFAFEEYAERWKFKRPRPADFFRTLEDASGIDLDWFWRGWFFSTDHVDVGISSIRQYRISTRDPDVEFEIAREESRETYPEPLQQSRNREAGRETYLERHPELKDYYDEHDRFTVTNVDRNEYQELLDDLEDWEREALRRAAEENDLVYFVDFENIGGLPTPLPLTITYAGGDVEKLMLPAEIWRRNSRSITKVLIRDREIESIALDNAHRTADADYSNNHFPRRIEDATIELYKEEDLSRDLMRDRLVPLHEAKNGGH